MSTNTVASAAVKRSMRIIALPLTASKTRPSASLTYYHFVAESSEKQKEKGWIGWGTTKAASMWADMASAPKGTWKVRVGMASILDDFRFRHHGLLYLMTDWSDFFKEQDICMGRTTYRQIGL